MKILKEAIEDIQELKKQLEEKNVCHTIFKDTISKEDVTPDVYYSARAFTSIINTLVNKKTEYAQYIIDSQLETLGFLNTFDDKYLSNLSNTMLNNTTSEYYFVNNLLSDINDLKDFLQNILLQLLEEDKEENDDEVDWELSDTMKKRIDEILKEFIKKYGGEENE